MRCTFTNYALRQLRKLPRNVQRRIIKKIKFYLGTENPLHFADSISNARGKVYRFRIGDYRIIFDRLPDRFRIIKISIRPRAYPRKKK